MAGQNWLSAPPGEYVRGINGKWMCVNNRFSRQFFTSRKMHFYMVISEYEGRIYIRRTEGYFYTVGWYHYSRE